MYTPLSFYHLLNQSDRSGLLDNVKDKTDFIAIYDETKYYLFEGYLDKGKKFSAYTSFYNWYNRLPESKKHCHEVLFGDKKQRIRFDIDSTTEAFGDKVRTLSTILSAITEELNSLINTTNFNIDKIDNTSFLITDSCDNNKVSYHITSIHLVFETYMHSKAFTERILNRLPEVYKNYIDITLDAKRKNLRLLGSHKVGSDRVKRINKKLLDDLGMLDNYNTLEYYTIHPPTSRCSTFIVPIVLESALKNKVVSDKISSEIADVPKFVRDWISDKKFSIRAIDNNIIHCDRISSSYCDICLRTHSKDNTLYISYNSDTNKYYECCRRESKKSILIINNDLYASKDSSPEQSDNEDSECSQIDSNDELITDQIINPIESQSKELDKKRKIKKDIKLEILTNCINKYSANNNKLAKEITCFDTLKNKLVYSEETMRPYDITKEFPIYAVKAQMKVGKNKQLLKLLESNYSLPNTRVVSLTFRRALTSSIKKDMIGFDSYLDLKGDIDLGINNKLIIQIESLRRLQLKKNKVVIPDLLIIDEVESIFGQFDSGNHQDLSVNMAVFSWLIRYSKNIIIMDANLSDRTFNLMCKFRKCDSDSIFYHCNDYKKAKDEHYFIATKYSEWISKMCDSLNNNKKLSITANSKTEANTISKLISDKYPDKIIRLYTAQTSDAIKDEHLSDVNKYWSECDVLIFSPTITAGVSYTADNFDESFIYATDKSCDVETSRQMEARVRNIKDKNHYLFINQRQVMNLPTNELAIKQYIKDRNCLDLFDVKTYVNISYDAKGQIKFHDTKEMSLKCNNTAHINKSKNNYTDRYIRQLIDSGATVSILNNLNFVDKAKDLNELKELTKEVKLIKKDLKDINATEIANAPIIDENEYNRITKYLQDIANGCKYTIVSDSEKRSREKYWLSKSYNKYDQELITDTFIKTYNNDSKKNIYYHLSKILEFTTTKEAINDFRLYSKLEYTTVIANKGLQAELLINKKDKDFDIHSSVIELINRCGYDDVFDNTKISLSKMETNIDKLYDEFLSKPNNLLKYDMLFESKKFNIYTLNKLRIANKEKFTKEIIKYCNTIISSTYGVKVYELRQQYILHHYDVNDLFYIDTEYNKEEQNGRPFILSKRIANKAKG